MNNKIKNPFNLSFNRPGSNNDHRIHLQVEVTTLNTITSNSVMNWIKFDIDLSSNNANGFLYKELAVALTVYFNKTSNG